MNQHDGVQSAAALNRVLEHDIMAARKGDWNAKHALERTFMPLMTSLAEKRTSDIAKINRYLDAGKRGLSIAVKKYNPKAGPDRFRIFALNFIEAEMDAVDRASTGGFWARLFGRH